MVLAALLAFQMQAPPRIGLSTSQFAAQYGLLRAMQEAKEKPSPKGLQAAVDQLSAIEHSFPSRIRSRSGAVIDAASAGQARVSELYWRTLDALVYSSGSDESLNEIPALMPKIGGELDTSGAIGRIEKALEVSKQDFDSGLWPGEKREADNVIAGFEAVPKEKRDEALTFILRTAGIAKSPKLIDILVIPRMAGKEGMTVRTPDGTLVVIGGEKYRGSDFAEVVLHESTHVLDTFAGDDSLFEKLRAALREAKRPFFEIEQVPHVAMFVLAAEAVRRNIDRSHVDVGTTFGAYARGLEPLRKVVAPVLQDLVGHRVALDEAVRRIVGALDRAATPGQTLPRVEDS